MFLMVLVEGGECVCVVWVGLQADRLGAGDLERLVFYINLT